MEPAAIHPRRGSHRRRRRTIHQRWCVGSRPARIRALVINDASDGRAELSVALEQSGFEVVTTDAGTAAWRLMKTDGISLVVLEPGASGTNGLHVCRRIRRSAGRPDVHIVVLARQVERGAAVAAFEAGADDYVVRPFNLEELRARLRVRFHALERQQRLSARLAELEVMLSRVKGLSGLLAICCYCKRVRRDEDDWEPIDRYIARHSDAEFSHGICPGCLEAAHEEIVRPESRTRPG